MINITYTKDINGLHININNSSKNIIKLKYDFGSYDSSYFADNGIDVKVTDKLQRSYSIEGKFEDGDYTFYMVFEDGTYSTSSIKLNEVEELINYKVFNNLKPQLTTTMMMPLDIDRFKTSMKKILVLYSNVNNDRLISDILSSDKYKLIDHNVFLDNNKVIEDLNEKSISLKNNIFTIKQGIQQNISGSYAYAALILDRRDSIILIADFLEPVLVTNLLDINISFSYKD